MTKQHRTHTCSVLIHALKKRVVPARTDPATTSVSASVNGTAKDRKRMGSAKHITAPSIALSLPGSRTIMLLTATGSYAPRKKRAESS